MEFSRPEYWSGQPFPSPEGWRNRIQFLMRWSITSHCKVIAEGRRSCGQILQSITYGFSFWFSLKVFSFNVDLNPVTFITWLLGLISIYHITLCHIYSVVIFIMFLPVWLVCSSKLLVFLALGKKNIYIFFGHAMGLCGILVPWSVIELMPHEVEVTSL